MTAPGLLADTTLTVVALALAVGGTALAVVLGGAALLLARERPSPAELRNVMREANAPLEAMVAQVARALERSAVDSPLGPASRLEDVLRQTVDAARRMGSADAAALLWERDGAEPRVVTSGLDEAADHDPALFRLAGADARSVVVTYRHAEGARDSNGEAIHAALAVPLKAADGSSAGSLTVFWREPARDPSDEVIARLEVLGARAAAAFDRAAPAGL